MTRGALGSAALAAALALAGCDVTYPWTSKTTPRPRVAVSMPSIDLTLGVDVLQPEPLTFRISDTPVHAWLEAEAAFHLASEAVFASTDLVIAPAVPASLGLGLHEGTLWLHVYVPVESSLAEVKGSPFRVHYAYLVTPPPLTTATTSITLTGPAGGPVLEATVQLDGPSSAGDWSATIEPADQSLTVSPESGDTLPATLTVRASATPARLFTGELRLWRRGSTTRIPLTVAVRPPPLVAPAAPVGLSVVHGREGGVPDLTFEVGTSTGAPCAIRGYFTTDPQGPSGWFGALQLPANAPGTVRLRMSGADAPGTFRGTIVVEPLDCLGGPLVIPVDLVLKDGAISFPTYRLFYMLNLASPAAAAVRSIPVTSSVPGTAISVALEKGFLTEQPWLIATPASAVPAPAITLEVKVDPAALSSGVQGNADMSVAVSWHEPDGAAVTRRIPVGRFTYFPAPTVVEPPAVAAGPVTVGGEDVPCDIANPVMFGDSAAVAMSCLYPGTVRATPPALPPGDYPVWLGNAVGVRREGARVTLLAPAPRAAASWPTPGRTTRVFFDERRRALYTIHPDAGKLVRRLEAGGWAAEDLTLSGLRDAALDSGGTRLIAFTGTGVRSVDPVTLAVADAAYPGDPVDPSAGTWDWTLAPSIFGHTLAIPGEAAACGTGGCTSYMVLGGSAGWAIWRYRPFTGAVTAPSGDLTRTLVASRASSGPALLFKYDELSGSEVPGLSLDASALALDRLGTRILALAAGPSGTSTRLLTEAYADVPGALPTSTEAALLVADGTRAITFDGAARTVRVFDLAAPLDAGTFHEAASASLVADPGAGVVLALSGDERTLFVAGDARLVVVPLP
ncbi:MAG: hypothetical protein QM704_19540 [Anaeromyxobacteraceae bacterium]